MEKKKFKIEELKVQSFVTAVDARKINGASFSEIPQGSCHVTDPEACPTGAYCGTTVEPTVEEGCSQPVGCTNWC